MQGHLLHVSNIAYIVYKVNACVAFLNQKVGTVKVHYLVNAVVRRKVKLGFKIMLIEVHRKLQYLRLRLTVLSFKKK